MYSPAALPSRQRAAPAKKRRLSAITGSSSFVTASIGLPAFSASMRASSSPCRSIRSASASSAFRSEEAQVVGHHRQLVVRDRLDRLARVQRLDAGELIAVPLDQVGQREQRLQI